MCTVHTLLFGQL